MIEKIPLKGIKVGHNTIREKGSGVTVISFDKMVPAGVGWIGFSSSTRQFDSLYSGHSVKGINALCLTGGSALGLTAGGGVQKFLLETGRGINIRGKTTVPIVPTAAIFDLFYKEIYYPDENDGYIAARNCSEEFEVGNAGVGTGATVGKIFSLDRTSRGGFGFSYSEIGGVTVMAFTVVNNFGNVLNKNGEIIAGVKDGKGGFVSDFLQFFNNDNTPSVENTNLSVVVTDASLTREELIKLSKASVSAFSKHFDPALSLSDGDIIVSVSVGEKKSIIDIIMAMSVETIGESIVSAIKYSRSI